VVSPKKWIPGNKGSLAASLFYCHVSLDYLSLTGKWF
jgi:hypothetical protein